MYQPLLLSHFLHSAPPPSFFRYTKKRTGRLTFLLSSFYKIRKYFFTNHFVKKYFRIFLIGTMSRHLAKFLPCYLDNVLTPPLSGVLFLLLRSRVDKKIKTALSSGNTRPIKELASSAFSNCFYL
jgi:hypothetical protein